MSAGKGGHAPGHMCLGGAAQRPNPSEPSQGTLCGSTWRALKRAEGASTPVAAFQSEGFLASARRVAPHKGARSKGQGVCVGEVNPQLPQDNHHD